MMSSLEKIHGAPASALRPCRGFSFREGCAAIVPRLNVLPAAWPLSFREPELTADLLWRSSALAQDSQCDGAVALGELAAVRIQNEPMVRVTRSRKGQQRLQQPLHVRSSKQVVAPRHQRDPLVGIVENNGEMI